MALINVSLFVAVTALTALLFSVLQLSVSAELFGVAELGEAEMTQKIAETLKSDDTSVFFMGNPRCPRCKRIEPEVAALREMYNHTTSHGSSSSVVRLFSIDCSQAAFFCHNKHRVEGYPGIKYFNKNVPEGEFYKGGQTAEVMKKAFDKVSRVGDETDEL